MKDERPMLLIGIFPEVRSDKIAENYGCMQTNKM